jgi:hypothetical protein
MKESIIQVTTETSIWLYLMVAFGKEWHCRLIKSALQYRPSTKTWLEMYKEPILMLCVFYKYGLVQNEDIVVNTHM